MAPALRRELESRLQPGERVEWVQQAYPSLSSILLRECAGMWVAAAGIILLAARALPMDTLPRESGGTALRMGGTPAFLWKDGDISILSDGAAVGAVCFVAGLLYLLWRVYKTSRLWKEVYAITNRRFLYLRPHLLDYVVEAAPLHCIAVCNKVVETLHRADIFISYPREVITDYTHGAPPEEVLETIRLRGILSPDTVLGRLRAL